MSWKNIIAELDDITDSVEKSGKAKLAARLDTVTNSLELLARTAGPMDIAMRPKSNGAPEGSEDADEAAHEDSYDAQNYHKVPVGPDSMSRYLGAPSPADMLSKLEFADEGEVNIQASKKGPKKQAPKPAAKKPAPKGKKKADGSAMDVDLGDDSDFFTTQGLPETGDEAANKPLDSNQEGHDLEFYGTEPAGTLHMPGSGGSESKEAPESNDKAASKSALARRILREAAEVVVEDPKSLHDSEKGENVERDQTLGGKGKGSGGESKEACDSDTYQDVEMDDDDAVDDGQEETANIEYASKKEASVKILRPTHVPRELMPLWKAAATHCQEKGTLLKTVRLASGEAGKAVNYNEIDRHYKNLLKGYASLAQKS